MKMKIKTILFTTLVLQTCLISAMSQTTEPLIRLATAATPRQSAWLAASLNGRVKIAERIGEEGARRYAVGQGWQSLVDDTFNTIPQGFDQVWKSTDGLIHVVEAKGGGSSAGHAYGYQQGTPEWAVKAAERTLKSSKTTVVEREAAEAVLKAAEKSRLQTHVIRTRHVLGEPMETFVESSFKGTDDSAKMARLILKRARPGAVAVDDAGRVCGVGDDVARVSDDLAKAGAGTTKQTSKAARCMKGVGKVAVPVALAVDGGFRVRDGIDIEQQYSSGTIDLEHREVAHAKNVAGMAGGWTGAWLGAKGGAILGGSAGTAVAPGAGTAVGGVVGGVVGGIGGYFGGEAVAEECAEWSVIKLHESGQTIERQVERCKDALDAAGIWCEEKFNDVGDSLEDVGSWCKMRLKKLDW